MKEKTQQLFKEDEKFKKKRKATERSFSTKPLSEALQSFCHKALTRKLGRGKNLGEKKLHIGVTCAQEVGRFFIYSID